MNDSVRTMMEMSVACLIFVMAATAGFLLFQSGADALDTTYVTGQNQDRNIRTTLSPIAGDGSVSGGEVMLLIAQLEENGLEIVVDGIRYVTPVEREDINVSGIRLQDRYLPLYERDPLGDIWRITYTWQGGAG